MLLGKENQVNLLLTLLIICLIIASISVGTVGVVLMSAISDLRVGMMADHQYDQTMSDIRRDDIIEAIEAMHE